MGVSGLRVSYPQGALSRHSAGHCPLPMGAPCSARITRAAIRHRSSLKGIPLMSASKVWSRVGTVSPGSSMRKSKESTLTISWRTSIRLKAISRFAWGFDPASVLDRIFRRGEGFSYYLARFFSRGRTSGKILYLGRKTSRRLSSYQKSTMI